MFSSRESLSGFGSFALATVQLHVESCGTAGSCGGGFQAYPAWIPEAFQAGLGSPMRSIPKTSSSSNQARFSFAGGPPAILLGGYEPETDPYDPCHPTIGREECEEPPPFWDC